MIERSPTTPADRARELVIPLAWDDKEALAAAENWSWYAGVNPVVGGLAEARHFARGARSLYGRDITAAEMRERIISLILSAPGAPPPGRGPGAPENG